MKVDGSLKSLLQGVSQQPPRDRLPGQCTLQDNMSADPIRGLTRRPASDLVNKLLTTADMRGWYEFDTEDGNSFISAFYENNVKVWDLNGVEKTVTVDTDARAYIATPGELRFNTMEKETFVVNRAKTVTMTALERLYFNRPANNQAFIIQVLGGAYGKRYTMRYNGTFAGAYTVPDGSLSTMIKSTRTSWIAQRLAEALSTAAPDNVGIDGTGSLLESPGLFAAAPWSVTRREDIIVVYNSTTGAQSTLTVNDDAGSLNFKSCGTTVPRVEDLPRYAPHNYVLRVAEKTDPETDIWFRFIVEGYEDDWTTTNSLTRFGQQGYWQETVAPLTKIELDASTMPHKLIHDPVTGTFRFQREAWAFREVGTTTSNPDPSFVGSQIKDVGTFQGRLVLLAGPNVIMSRTNKNENFWFQSVSAQADSDPIDVRSKVEASSMQAVIQHNRDLVIFSSKGQFIIFGRTSLTPANAALVLTSSFEAELNAKPVGAGRNVFFATNFGSYSGVREFFVESGTDINDSREVTQHVKRYIQGTATRLAASSNYNTLIVSTDKDRREQYWYQYIWNDNEKVQSAHSKLIFSHPVHHTFFIEETIYTVQRDANDYYLHRMSLDVQDSLGVGYHIHLDNQFDVLEVNTQFVLPYPYLKDLPLVVVQSTDCPTPGLIVPIQSIVFDPGFGWVVTLKKNMLGGDVIVGSAYNSAYVPTMPMVKDTDQVKVGTGFLTLSKFRVALYQTGFIRGQMRSKYGNGVEISFNGRYVGDVDNLVGVQPLSDSTFILPFGQKADNGDIILWTDSHLPMTMLDIEWDGQYNKRGKRITTGA